MVTNTGIKMRNSGRIRNRVMVLTSTWPLFPGDARTPFVRDLAFDLKRLGWDVKVLAPHAAGAETDETIDGIRAHRFRYMLPERWQRLAYGAGGLVNLAGNPLLKATAPAFVLAQIASAARLARTWRPDVIHAHWILPQGWTAAVVGREFGIPVVSTVHGGDVFGLKGPLMRQFKAAAIRGAQAVTVNSSATRDAALDLGASPDRMTTIRFAPSFDHAIDPGAVAALRAGFEPDAFIALFAGRLVPVKGGDDFLDAIALALPKTPRLRAVVAGTGPEEAALRARAERLGIADHVTFAGWLEPAAMAAWMQAADVFVGLSKRMRDGTVEAQGIVFLEAMRAGTPVLATRSGGIPDIVRDGETGFLVPEGDTQAAAAVLVRLANGQIPDLAAVTAAGRRLATEDITRERTAQAFSDLFEGTIDAYRNRRC
jgi:glycosyltransferase involved in cell wall biosynthesis